MIPATLRDALAALVSQRLGSDWALTEIHESDGHAGLTPGDRADAAGSDRPPNLRRPLPMSRNTYRIVPVALADGSPRTGFGACSGANPRVKVFS